MTMGNVHVHVYYVAAKVNNTAKANFGYNNIIGFSKMYNNIQYYTLMCREFPTLKLSVYLDSSNDHECGLPEWTHHYWVTLTQRAKGSGAEELRPLLDEEGQLLTQGGYHTITGCPDL